MAKMSKGPMSGAQGAINRAAGEMPKKEVSGRPNTGSVGNERKADVRGAQEGGSAAEAGGTRNQLHGAVQHLRSEPVRHSPHVSPNHGHPYGR